MRNETIDEIVATAIPGNALPEQWDMAGLQPNGCDCWRSTCRSPNGQRRTGSTADEVASAIMAAADRKMAEKSANYGPELMRMAEKSLLLQMLDQIWKDHLLSLDHLRQGIDLRGYAPARSAERIQARGVRAVSGDAGKSAPAGDSLLSHVELRVPQPVFAAAMPEPEEAMARGSRDRHQRAAAAGPAASATWRVRKRRRWRRAAAGRHQRVRRGAAPRATRLARAAPGRKFKHCHGRV